MALRKTTQISTHFFDLDWNRHVTSRTYERFGYEGRFAILQDLGFGVHFCLENGIEFVTTSTFVRFLSQQFAGSKLNVITDLCRDSEGNLYFNQQIEDETSKKVCELFVTVYLKEKSGSKLQILEVPLLTNEWKKSQIHPKKSDQTTVKHKLQIPFSDMSCFWNLPSEAIWKIFEEGRFLFFKEIVDLKLIKETDSTTFFMGGEIQIFELPNPGSNITLLSWIESFEKIRFYFRQDIVSNSGETLASMRDEQLFVSLSSSRPRKAPPEFFSRVERFIEPA